MNCREARPLIHAYVDGELDLVRSVEMEGHLADCGACHQALESQKVLSGLIRTSDIGFDVPAGLEKRILSAARKESRTFKEPGSHRPRRFRMPLLAACAGAAVLLICLLSWRFLRTGPRTGDALAEEAVSSHVRSLMANHLMDVASTDQHTVKPWFLGKLDYSPPVVDFAAEGFPLIGGRLDYLQGRPVAALVYRRRKHVVNLFVWPDGRGADERATGFRGADLRGYHTVSWSGGGMSFDAVSDVAPADLLDFARKVSGSR